MSTIPRFLLPRRGPMWQTRLSGSAAAASRRSLQTTSRRCAGGNNNILEKPTKFNPPSHGARLPRRGANPNAPPSQHYGGDLSAAEQAAQRARQYPGMMAPPGTWAHWFWTSRMFHMTLTMSTLTLLALYTFVENFKRRSPFVDMLPSTLGEVAAHPIDALTTLITVMRMTEHHRVLEIAEKRQQRIDDVAKRTMYRKAHGMDETVGFGSNGGWLADFAKKTNAAAPTAPVRNETEEAVVDDASPVRGAMSVGASASETDTPEKRKKFLGIF